MALEKISHKDMRHCNFLKSTCDTGDPPIMGPHEGREGVREDVPPYQSGLSPRAGCYLLIIHVSSHHAAPGSLRSDQGAGPPSPGRPSSRVSPDLFDVPADRHAPSRPASGRQVLGRAFNMQISQVTGPLNRNARLLIGRWTRAAALFGRRLGALHSRGARRNREDKKCTGYRGQNGRTAFQLLNWCCGL